VRAILSVAAGALDCSVHARGSADLVARLIGQFLSERLGQQFIIELGAAARLATIDLNLAINTSAVATFADQRRHRLPSAKPSVQQPSLILRP
jgi:hypothetical protein